MPTAQDLEVHRPALMGHCYRMLGSAAEADVSVQETMIRAWKALDRFEERSSLRTWLYRIASRVCLDALGDHYLTHIAYRPSAPYGFEDR